MSKIATKVQWNPDKEEAGISNVSRAEQAIESIQLYAIAKGDKGDDEYIGHAVDLIADILHFLASQNVDPESELKTALMHFEAER